MPAGCRNSGAAGGEAAPARIAFSTVLGSSWKRFNGDITGPRRASVAGLAVLGLQRQETQSGAAQIFRNEGRHRPLLAQRLLQRLQGVILLRDLGEQDQRL